MKNDLKRQKQRVFRRGVKRLLGTSVFTPLRSIYTGFGSVLMYHRIREKAVPAVRWGDQSVFTPNIDISVTQAAFERQMRLIRERYEPTSLADFDRILRDEKSQQGGLL